MKTKPLYLEDSYVKEMEATILDVKSDEPQSHQVVLSQTVFYPMGGGQPTDQGKLIGEGWQVEVNKVMMIDGEIVHFIKGDLPEVGMKVKGMIDWDRRYRNMKTHSAGHVIDFALYLLGYSPEPLYPFKGDHGKKPYIVYKGTAEVDFRDQLVKKIEELNQSNAEFSTQFVEFQDLKGKTLYLQPGLPENKPLRLLTLEGIGSVADGGTQVKFTAETGSIEIVKIESKEGFTTIHYRL